MIQTYSSTIRRKEMEAVLTCMVDEKIGPGEMSTRLVQLVKEKTGCDGAVALRSPSVALEYALAALEIEKGSSIMLGALSPSWQIVTVERLGYKPIVLDVEEETGLVPVKNVEEGIQKGGKAFILTESMGILPEIKPYLYLGVPVIEDVSQSAMARYPDENPENTGSEVKKPSGAEENQDGSTAEDTSGTVSGMYGSYAIMGMEDRDIITAGGGAVLFAPARKDWSALKKYTDAAPSTDLMPDMNASLALVELKEFKRNEESRQSLYALFSRAVMSGRHKTFVRASGSGSTVYSFPLVLSSGFKDVKAYAQKKGVEVSKAFSGSIIDVRNEEFAPGCVCANSLFMRCALFPLYPRLGQKDAERIVKILASLP
ncbi:MAG: DegT/DnrJ/EryC1/StrS aminotransferase family protein [Treponema sp.]|nr:DegT/DnrJ/EryC1/StrS aminotransferase family protein [Treponema sp.]MBQ4236102.1 DegT/DnrJ/EryC1/StrS aminotransferase family protein [Treponema sp.]MBQ5384895.1 DegT/DnrJ/EryC1/StrS aminotransferase family protein [Treponema sp.]